jgi:hypothetical protein
MVIARMCDGLPSGVASALMEAKHVITQLIGTAVSVLLVRWGWKEFRRDWRVDRRLPLVTGPYLGGRTLLTVLGVFAALVPILIAIVKLELVPKGSSSLFVAMLAWTSVGFVFALLGLTSTQTRRSAKGWLSVVGEDSLRIEAEGGTATLKLVPGAARLSFIDGAAGSQYVQLDIDDGAARAHVWGMIGLRDSKLVGPARLAQAQGLMVATSMSPLCRWLAPYLARESSESSD